MYFYLNFWNKPNTNNYDITHSWYFTLWLLLIHSTLVLFSWAIYEAIKFFMWSLNCGSDGLTLHLMIPCWFQSNKCCDLMSPSKPMFIKKKNETECNIRTRLEPNHQTFLLPCSTSHLDESSHCLSTEPKPRPHALREVSKHSGFLKRKTFCWWKLKGAP